MKEKQNTNEKSDRVLWTLIDLVVAALKSGAFTKQNKQEFCSLLVQRACETEEVHGTPYTSYRLERLALISATAWLWSADNPKEAAEYAKFLEGEATLLKAQVQEFLAIEKEARNTEDLID